MAESLASVAGDAAIVELIISRGNDDIEPPCVSLACPSTSTGTLQGGSSEQSSLSWLGGSPAISFTPCSLSGKRRLVQRMASCEGPIACHVLQGYMEQCFGIHTSRDVGAPPPCHVELEQWITSLLDGALDCCKPAAAAAAADGDSSERSKSQRVRSAIFLMELCSTITRRGDGGRRRDGEEALVGVQGGRAPRVRHDIVRTKNKKESASQGQGRDDGGRDLQPGGNHSASRRVGSEFAGRYLWKLLETTGELMRLEHGLDDRHDPNESGRLGGEDAAYWALTLVSEVLRWAPPAAPPPAAAAAAAAAEPGHVAPFDLESLVSALCGIPLVPKKMMRGSGSGMVDLALKWLEVTELLVTGAALEAPSAFRCLCDSVPRVLWQLADHSRPMLGSYGPLRPAGQTFVEERGAGGTMLQAMLRLAFKIVKVQLEQGCSEAQHDVRSQRGKHGPNGAGADGDGRVAGDADICVGGAWRTPADVITGTFVKRSCGPAGDAGEAQGHQEESDTCIGSHLVRLFCEQDDMLVDMLLTNLHIYRRLCGDQAVASDVSSETMGDMRRLYEHHLHPAVLFSTFLSEVSFDSRLLLDWLISPETSFLAYLTLILRLALADWPDFVVHVSSSSSLPLLDKGIIGVTAVTARDMEGEGDDGDDEEEDEEAVVLSEEGTVRLTRVMDCLAALATSARGLEKRGLLPYDLTPMLKRIKQVQDLFEECESAEDGDGAATARGNDRRTAKLAEPLL